MMAVEAINRQEGIVLMVGGKVWPVSVWLDASGDECDEPNAAFAVVGPCSDATRPEFWVTLELSDFETVPNN
jgi:hypothetical protein